VDTLRVSARDRVARRTWASTEKRSCPYNFNPASIFMGDCGSMTVGFLLGCFGVVWSQKSATVLGMTAP